MLTHFMHLVKCVEDILNRVIPHNKYQVVSNVTSSKILVIMSHNKFDSYTTGTTVRAVGTLGHPDELCKVVLARNIPKMNKGYM